MQEVKYKATIGQFQDEINIKVSERIVEFEIEKDDHFAVQLGMKSCDIGHPFMHETLLKVERLEKRDWVVTYEHKKIKF